MVEATRSSKSLQMGIENSKILRMPAPVSDKPSLATFALLLGFRGAYLTNDFEELECAIREKLGWKRCGWLGQRMEERINKHGKAGNLLMM